MKYISNQKNLTIEGEFRRSFSKNRKLGVVAQHNHSVAALVVRDKGAIVGEHHVCGARVSAAVVVISHTSEYTSLRRVQLVLDEGPDRGTWLCRGGSL